MSILRIKKKKNYTCIEPLKLYLQINFEPCCLITSQIRIEKAAAYTYNYITNNYTGN